MDSGSMFRDPFRAASPLAIPSKTVHRCATPPEHVSDLLERTRIPKRFARNRKKTSCGTSPSLFECLPSYQRKGTTLFEDQEEESLTPTYSLPNSYSYLLTPPNSIPDLSRSCSTNSFDSASSGASSQCLQTSRIHSPCTQEILAGVEDPLAPSQIPLRLANDGLSRKMPVVPPRRRSSLNVMLWPLKAVVPALKASNVVSTLSTSLSSWAASLSASQYDPNCGLLPSSPMFSNAGLVGRGVVHQSLPRPVSTSGPQRTRATLIDAEMERPLLASEDEPPVYIELLPWCAKGTTRAENLEDQRPREPRLNPDFLRILVLETNMRRLGKFSSGPGRARMILSPRCGEHGMSPLRQSSITA